MGWGGDALRRRALDRAPGFESRGWDCFVEVRGSFSSPFFGSFWLGFWDEGCGVEVVGRVAVDVRGVAGDAMPARRLSPLRRSPRGVVATKRPDFRRPLSMIVDGPSASTFFHGGEMGFGVLMGVPWGVVSRMRRRLAGRSPSSAAALGVAVPWSLCSIDPSTPFCSGWSATD